MLKRLVFEVGDDLLDDGVVAVLGFHDLDRLGAPGEKREVAPLRGTAWLGRELPGASDDQPPTSIGGLSDLRRAAGG